jgi:hypothetical protein
MERAQPPFRYELRHRRLADAALRELEAAGAGRGGATALLSAEDEPTDERPHPVPLPEGEGTREEPLGE